MKFVRNSLWNELPGASGPILYDIAVRAKPDEQRFQQIVCYGVRRERTIVLSTNGVDRAARPEPGANFGLTLFQEEFVPPIPSVQVTGAARRPHFKFSYHDGCG
jgi:hypothetical protein